MSTRNSLTSTVMAETRSALAAYLGSSRRSSAYSFIVEPQPADTTTTFSTPASRNTSMLRRAMARAVSRSPLWRFRAPQQPWPAGTATRQPFLASTRTDASMVRGCTRGITQPDSSPTKALGSPTAWTVSREGPKKGREKAGKDLSSAASLGKTRSSRRVRRSSD